MAAKPPLCGQRRYRSLAGPPVAHVRSSCSGRVAAKIRTSHPPCVRPHPPTCPRGRGMPRMGTECLTPSRTPSLLLRTPRSCFSAREMHSSLDFPGLASTTGSQGPPLLPRWPWPQTEKAIWLPWAFPRPGCALVSSAPDDAGASPGAEETIIVIPAAKGVTET